MKVFAAILIAIAAAVALPAQTASSPFIGTWKLNAAKSKYNPGPARKSEIITIAEDGTVTVDGVQANGDKTHWSYVYTDGREATISGMENSSVLETRNGDTVRHLWKLNGSNYIGRGVLNRDHNVMTYTLTGTNQQGRRQHDELVYDKQ